MAAVGKRLCLLGVGLLSVLVLAAGLGQLVCGLYLLLKVPQAAVNGATIAAGVWDVLVGLVTLILCFVSPLRPSRRSQLHLAAFCSAPVTNGALGVLIGLAPHTERQADVAKVCFVLVVSTLAAAAAAFVAGNAVFCMQLTFDQYRPGTRAWKSPKSASSGESGFPFSQGEMTQKPAAPDLWMSGAVPLASWVYHTQSSVETARCETQLDAPASRSSCGSLALHTAQAAAPHQAADDPASPGGRLPRCLSLLSAIYGPSRGGWPPTGRQPRSCSLLEVRRPSPAEPFPPAPAPLCASPLPTPVAERPTPDTPLVGTIGRLTCALSRLHSDPNYRASRELQEAIEALEALQATPSGGEDRPRPTSAASSGYGSPDGPPEPGRRSVMELTSLLERGRRATTPLRRPTVPPPPPPPPPPPGCADQSGRLPTPQGTGATAAGQPGGSTIESEC